MISMLRWERGFPVLSTNYLSLGRILSSSISVVLYRLLAAVVSFFPINRRANFSYWNCTRSGPDFCRISFRRLTQWLEKLPKLHAFSMVSLAFSRGWRSGLLPIKAFSMF